NRTHPAQGQRRARAFVPGGRRGGAIMEIMMILGPYPFGLNTAAFQELNRNTEWRWPGQDVFEGVPALQFTGYGKDTITLPGVIFPEYWGGTGQLDALRALADQGQPQTLIDGRGN